MVRCTLSSKKVSKYSDCTVSEFALDKNKPKPALGITCKSIMPKKEIQTVSVMNWTHA